MHGAAGPAAPCVHHVGGDCFRVPDVCPHGAVRPDRAAATPVQGDEAGRPAEEQRAVEGNSGDYFLLQFGETFILCRHSILNAGLCQG